MKFDKRLFGAGLWAGAIAGYVYFARSRNLGPVEAAEEVRQILSRNWWGPVLFIVFYSVRPLVLFPASVLTVLGGLAFGPIWGSLWTIVAANLSAAVTYGVGRFFGSQAIIDRMGAVFGSYFDRAMARPFETTLIMRLVYLPFDLVGYAAGFLSLNFGAFMVGSFLGMLPGIVAFVGFGASVDSLGDGSPSLDYRILAASVLLAGAGMLGSRWLRQRSI